MTPADRKYSREHEWVKLEEGGSGLVGITDFAQDELGDVVYLDLPAVGTRLEQSAKMGEVESVKAVSDIFSPVTGEVVGINQDAIDHRNWSTKTPTGRAGCCGSISRTPRAWITS